MRRPVHVSLGRCLGCQGRASPSTLHAEVLHSSGNGSRRHLSQAVVDRTGCQSQRLSFWMDSICDSFLEIRAEHENKKGFFESVYQTHMGVLGV